MNIYELTGAFAQIQSMIEHGQEGLDDTLKSIECALEDKVEGYVSIIKNITSDIEGLKAEEKRLAERRKSLESSIDRMKSALEFALINSNKDKVKTSKFTVSFRKSSSVEITNEALVPSEFIKIERKVDKAQIKNLLKHHELEFARLVDKQNLQIK